MAIPRLPQLPNKYITRLPSHYGSLPQLPKLPSIPDVGKKYQPGEFWQDVQRRKEYFFDINNHGEVNSLADVLVNTMANVWKISQGEQRIAPTLQQLAEDSYNLLNKGFIQPILNHDGQALMSNQLVNIVESVDVFDNMYKGYMMEGTEGFKKSVFERKNYEWDTGNKAKDFALEIATPTNLALAALTFGQGLAAKSAVKQAGMTMGRGMSSQVVKEGSRNISKRAAKTFLKKYTGNVDDTLRLVGKTMNLTQTDTAMLKEVAKHATNLKILKSMNYAKQGINLVDDVGPQLVFASTILPMKTIVKAGMNVTGETLKYMSRVMEQVVPNKNLVGFFDASPELTRVVQTLADAEALGTESKVLEAWAPSIADVASNDVKRWQSTIKSTQKTMDSSRLIKRYATELAERRGTFVSFEEAKALHTFKMAQDTTKVFDQVARELSNESFKTFDEYYAFVSKLYNTHATGSELEVLYGMLKHINHFANRQRAKVLIEKIVKPVSDLTLRLKNVETVVKRYTTTEWTTGPRITTGHSYDVALAGIDKEIRLVRNRLNAIPNKEMLLRELDKLSGLSIASTTKRATAVKAEMDVVEESLNFLRNAVKNEPFDKLTKKISERNASMASLSKRLRVLKNESLELNAKLMSELGVTKLHPFDIYDDAIKRYKEILLGRFNDDMELPSVYKHHKALEYFKMSQNAARYQDELADLVRSRDVLSDMHNNVAFVMNKYTIKNNMLLKSVEREGEEILTALITDYTNLSADLDNLIASMPEDILKEQLAHHMEDIRKLLEMAEVTKAKYATLEVRKNAAEYGKVLRKDTVALFEQITDVVNGMTLQLTGKDGAEGFEQFTDLITGGRKGLAKAINNTVTAARKQYVERIEVLVKQSLPEGVKDPKLKNISNRIKLIVNDLKYVDDSSAQFSEGMYESFGNTLEHIEMLSDWIKTEGLTQKQLSKYISELFEEFEELKYLIPKLEETRKLPSKYSYEAIPITAKGRTKMLSDVDAMRIGGDYTEEEILAHINAKTELLTSAQTEVTGNPLDHIHAIEDLFGLDADISIKHTLNNIREYRLKLNAFYRNMYILDNDTVHEMLDMVQYYTYDEGMKSIEALAHMDMSQLNTLKVMIDNNNMTDAAKLYRDITGLPMNVQRTQTAIALHDELVTQYENARKIMSTLEGMVSMRTFFSRLGHRIGDSEDRGLINHLLDAMQREYDRPAALASLSELTRDPGALDNIIYSIKENVANQFRSESNKYSHKLQNWYDYMKVLTRDGDIPEEVLEQYATIFPDGMAHTAIADAYRDWLVRTHALKAEIPHNVKQVFMDTETNMTNIYSATIHQQSVFIPETNTFHWYINGNVPNEDGLVNDELLHLLFDDPDPEEWNFTTDKLRTLYDKVHHKGDAEALRSHFKLPKDTPIKIIMADGEADMLMKAQTFVEKQRPSGGRIQYSMFNGREFDAPLINNRSNLHKGSWHIDPLDTLDTRVELEDLKGIKRLTKSQEYLIEDTIREYVDIRLTEMGKIMNFAKGTVTDALKVQDETKFITSVDSDFRDALKSITDYFSGTNLSPEEIALRKTDALANKVDFSTRVAMTGDPQVRLSYQKLNDFTASIDQSLEVLNKTERQLGTMQFHMEKGKSIRILDEEKLFGDIPKELRADLNVMVDLSEMNTFDGMYTAVFGVKRTMDANVISEMFHYMPDEKFSGSVIKTMTEMAMSIQNMVGRVRNQSALTYYSTGYDGAMAMESLKAFQTLIIDELKVLSGTHYFSPVIERLKETTNIIQQYAITRELYKVYSTVASDLKVKVDPSGFRNLEGVMRKLDMDRAMDVMNPKRVMSSPYAEQSAARLFKLDQYDPDGIRMVDWCKRSLRGSIDTLQKFEEVSNDTIKYARLKRVSTIYKRTYESFDIAERIATKYGDGKPEKVYALMRPVVEAMNESIAYAKLTDVLTQTPEDMAAYIWHKGKGFVTFKYDDLSTSGYFKTRNLVKSLDVLKRGDALTHWEAIIDNLKAYRDLGISIESHRGRVVMYIKNADIDKVRNLPYKRATQDYNIDSIMDEYIEKFSFSDEIFKDPDAKADLKKLIESMLNARLELTKIMPEGMTSTLEKLDRRAMEKLYNSLDIDLPDLMDMDTLLANNRFVGEAFNHSVLGAIDSRRELMPFASFNPAKNMYHAVDMMHDMVSKQAQFVELLQSPDMNLEAITKGMASSDEVLQYLKNAPHLKVVFLNKDAKKGFKLSAITINSVKDITFAHSVNAIVLDRNTYIKAYEIINGNKLPEGLIKTLDHTLVAPYKLGWMAYNYGTVLRNIYDSGLKNMHSTGDLKIIGDMMAATKLHYSYKQATNAIHTIQEAQKISLEGAIDIYFEGQSVIDRNAFDLITEFSKNSNSTGMVQEAQKWYGDAIDKLYRSVNGVDSGLTDKQFREFMRQPDEAARGWLMKHLPENPTRTDMLMTVHDDLYYYKRAYAMTKHYNKPDMTTEMFVRYLKRQGEPGYIPQDFLPEFNRLLDKTKNIKVEETMFEKAMAHPIMSNALTLNANVEDVMRFALYKNLVEGGFSVDEAMAQVIKTHFDYGHKSQAQMYLEMLFPFSTFRINSTLYWMEMLGKSTMAIELATKSYGATSNIQDLDVEDIIMRRGLQYQMFTGNVIINDDGLTVKLTPSVIDFFNFAADPVGYVAGSVHSLIGSTKQFLEMEPYEGEDPQSFSDRKWKLGWQLMPLVGSHIARLKYDPDRSPIVNALLGPLFNNTWTPSMKKELTRYTPTKRLYVSRKYSKRYTTKRWKYVPRGRYVSYSRYNAFNRYYYSAQTKFNRSNVQLSKNTRMINWTYSSIRGRTLSKKGTPKYRFLAFPTNKWTMPIKIGILRNMRSYVRYNG